jgi:RNA polymerase sigma-70 factor (ECF subfamily)
MIQSEEDTALLESIASERNEDAFAAFYLRHVQPARTLAFRITKNVALADDALQESMLQVWRRAGAFHPGNARAWLRQIVARESIRVLQRTRTQNDRAAESDSRPDESTLREEETERQQLLVLLQRFIGELPGTERALVRLRFSEGLSQRQISAVMHMPQQTVSSRLKRALEFLRRRFEMRIDRN